jgi:sodium/potassium/calcium exchanger 6
MWISFISHIIIDLIQLIGMILDLPNALLGLTLLAWGNTLGDLSASVSMTKKGFGEMAATGCLAGPIFNILLGLGVSNTLTIIKMHSLLKE